MISTTADETRRACAPRVRLVTVKQLRGELKGSPVRMPHAAARHAREFLEGEDREHFLVLQLDSKYQVVSIEVASIGTLSSSLVHPREVFKGAILANAAAVICAHNHPSGNVEPSTDDREVLKRLVEAGRLLGVPVLDFLIVTDDEHWSASERGLLDGGARS